MDFVASATLAVVVTAEATVTAVEPIVDPSTELAAAPRAVPAKVELVNVPMMADVSKVNIFFSFLFVCHLNVGPQAK